MPQSNCPLGQVGQGYPFLGLLPGGTLSCTLGCPPGSYLLHASGFLEPWAKPPFFGDTPRTVRMRKKAYLRRKPQLKCSKLSVKRIHPSARFRTGNKPRSAEDVASVSSERIRYTSSGYAAAAETKASSASGGRDVLLGMGRKMRGSHWVSWEVTQIFA